MELTGNILITGGSGTLGNAIVRMAKAEGWPCNLTIYSRSEFLQAQMRAKHPDLRYVLGDVRDYERLVAAVVGHDIVIHAAAMKRIPECEANPTECFATNVQGSANVVRACIAGGVKRCVGISTDKACRAITTYGASKLMMEGLFQAAPVDPCTFTLVRYGNVLASRGSVIPLWRDQAARGEPITITDRRMTRFWMSEADAVRTVLSGLKRGPGAIYVPMMGALNVLEMAAIIAPTSVTVETGLRSCEKLHEDLVHMDERVETDGDCFVIGYGRTGLAYTSDIAPRLTDEAFLAMLEDAEVIAC